MQSRRGAAAVLGALAALLLLPVGAADEPPPTIVAGPGAWLTNYAVPVAASQPDAPPMFLNGDLMPHDVVAFDHGPDASFWCSGFEPGSCPLFWTPLIPLGASTPVYGVENLEPGKAYLFKCTTHAGMKGALVALPET